MNALRRIASIVLWGLVGAVVGLLAAIAMSYFMRSQRPNEAAAGFAGMLSMFITVPVGTAYGLFYGATRRTTAVSCLEAESDRSTSSKSLGAKEEGSHAR